MSNRKIAIIGSGTGLSLAWLLNKNFNVTIFEKEERLGGHINSVPINGKIMEAGAEFINPNYKNFLKLLNHLELEVKNFIMTMKFDNNGETTLFTPNPFEKVSFELMNEPNWDDVKLPAELLKIIFKYKLESDKNQTLSDWISKIGENEFAEKCLYHLVASSYGVTEEDAKTYLIKYAMNYFSAGNIYMEVVGGLSQYIDKLKALIEENCSLLTGCQIDSVHQCENNTFTLMSGDEEYKDFDDVIFCTSAEVTSKIISGVDSIRDCKNKIVSLSALKEKLRNVTYYDTKIIFEKTQERDAVVNIAFDGNSSRTSITKSWNSDIAKRWADPKSDYPNSLATFTYRHPNMDTGYDNANKAIKSFNSQLTGIYFGSILAGFDDSHESGICASISVAKLLCDKYHMKKTSEMEIFESKAFFCC